MERNESEQTFENEIEKDERESKIKSNYLQQQKFGIPGYVYVRAQI